MTNCICEFVGTISGSATVNVESKQSSWVSVYFIIQKILLFPREGPLEWLTVTCFHCIPLERMSEAFEDVFGYLVHFWKH